MEWNGYCRSLWRNGGNDLGRIEKLELKSTDYGLPSTTSENAVVSSRSTVDQLTVLGTSLLSDTLVNGNLDVGTISITPDGSINSIGTLKLQPTGIAGIDFLNGLVQIDQKGNLVIKSGQITGNDSFRGIIPLSAGQTEAVVAPPSGVWDNPPRTINANASYDTYIWVESIANDKVVLKFKNPPSKEEKIYWSAIW